MSSEEARLREALAQIADVANAALEDRGEDAGHDGGYSEYEGTGDAAEARICTPKALPKRLLVDAAVAAVEINPANAPHFGPVAIAEAAFDISDPLKIAVLTSKYWGPQARRLTVSFMETTPANLRARILQHMNAWTRTVSIQFVETQGTGDVRISRGPGGYWSYLGTDIRLIPRSQPTMNLEGFTMSTPESEFRRVIRHETGHTLGAPHEHMRRDLVARIDRAKAYDYFWRTQGWNRKTVDQQVLTPLEESSLMATRADQTSIMCYQLPGSITRDGKPILGGLDINQTDYDFLGKLYPRHASTPAHDCADEWAGYPHAA